MNTICFNGIIVDDGFFLMQFLFCIKRSVLFNICQYNTDIGYHKEIRIFSCFGDQLNSFIR